MELTNLWRICPDGIRSLHLKNAFQVQQFKFAVAWSRSYKILNLIYVIHTPVFSTSTIKGYRVDVIGFVAKEMMFLTMIISK